MTKRIDERLGLEAIEFAPGLVGGPALRVAPFQDEVYEEMVAAFAGLRARGSELVGELERYEDSYRLCYVRGPEGIIIELAEQIG